MALTELSRYLPRHDIRTRYLRKGVRIRDGHSGAFDMRGDPHEADFDGDRRRDLLLRQHVELPPGASFEPDPHHGWDPVPAQDSHEH